MEELVSRWGLIAFVLGVLFWLHRGLDQRVIKMSQKWAKVEREVELLQYELPLMQRKADQ